MMISRSAFAVACLFIATTSTASAQLPPGLVSECDFCLCSQGISPLEMGGSAIRYDARYTDLSHEYINGSRVPNAKNARETYVTNQLSLIYHIAPGLSATLIAPFAHKTVSEIDPVTGASSFTNSGLGDVSLIGRYNLLADHAFGDTRIVAATLGVKFANGLTTAMNGSEPANADLQLGTGTTDFIAGFGYMLGFERWNIGANLLAGLRGFGSGASGHVYGNNLNYDVTLRYRLYQNDSGDPTIFGAFGVRGEWRGYELQDGQRIDGSGGDVTYVAPGVQVFLSRQISLDATVWIPVVHALNGDQVAETVKVLAGFQYGF